VALQSTDENKEQYSYLRHLLWSSLLGLDSAERLLMFAESAVFFDASGNDNTIALTVAGYLFTRDRAGWVYLNRNFGLISGTSAW
jgi:hypothetical protein